MLNAPYCNYVSDLRIMISDSSGRAGGADDDDIFQNVSRRAGRVPSRSRRRAIGLALVHPAAAEHHGTAERCPHRAPAQSQRRVKDFSNKHKRIQPEPSVGFNKL